MANNGYNGYPNYETWLCSLYYENTNLMTWYEDYYTEEEMEQKIADDYDDIVRSTGEILDNDFYGTLSEDCGYRTSSTIFEWAMVAFNKIDFDYIAKNWVDEFITERRYERGQ